MAQQVFNQWVPVAKAQNEQGQEVYLPFAGIHAQTRDGKDEVIVGAGNMVWTGSMWVPVSNQNRLPVEATLSGQTEVIKLVDALASTDPVTITTNYIENLGEYRAWDIYLHSTLDVQVRVRLVWGSELQVDGVLMADGSILYPRLDATWQGHQLLATEGPIRLAYVPWKDNQELADREYYQKRLSPRVAVQCRTTSAATAGALSIWFVGRR